jgi:hypothetical protein
MCRAAALLVRAYLAIHREQLTQRLHVSGVTDEYFIVRHLWPTSTKTASPWKVQGAS